MMAALGWLGPSSHLVAAEIAVPLSVQCKLLDTIVRYDRNMAGRFKGSVKLMVVQTNDATSNGSGAHVDAILALDSTLGGFSLVLERHEFLKCSSPLTCVPTQRYRRRLPHRRP
jgi:hypothetical protein